MTQQSVQISLQSKIRYPDQAKLRTLLKKTIPHVKKSPREISFVLVGDAMMSKLHVEFMNIPGPTDVLTFPIDQDARGRTLTGEIIVCIPEARRRAKENGVPLLHEVLLYCLHGWLHLSGHDDRNKRDFERMHAEEDRILTRLGVGQVFAPKTTQAK